MCVVIIVEFTLLQLCPINHSGDNELLALDPELEWTHKTSPLELFNAWYPRELREKQANWTARHAAAGAKESFKDYKGPPTVETIDCLVASYILNGLHPHPTLRDYWSDDKFAFGDNTIQGIWAHRGGYRCMEQCKALLRFADPAVVLATKATDPLALVRPLLTSLRGKCESIFIAGPYTWLC
jgi:hypothetical protein